MTNATPPDLITPEPRAEEMVKGADRHDATRAINNNRTKEIRTVRFSDDVKKVGDQGPQNEARCGARVDEGLGKQKRYRMTQEDKIEKMAYANSEKEFIINRALGQHVRVNVRPDVCAPIQLLAPGRDPPTKKEAKTLQKITQFLKYTASQGWTSCIST